MEQQLTMNETEPAAEKSGKGADTAKPVTRATKAKRQKEILRALLEKKPYKWNELLEEAVKEYTAKYPEENADIPDIKGKFGSNFSLMEDAGEVLFDKATNMCSLKIEEPKKRGRKPAAGKAEKTSEAVQEKEEEKRTAIEESLKKAVEKAVAKAEASGRKRTKKSAAETAEMQAAEPTSGAKPEAKSETKSEAKAEEKPQPKKRGRKPAAKAAEPVPAPADSLAPAPVTEEKSAEKPAGKVMEKAAEKTMKNAPEKAAEKTMKNAPEKAAEKTMKNAPEKAAEKKEEKSPAKAEKTPAKKDAFKDLWLTDFVFLGNASSAKKEEKAASKAEAAPAAKAEEKSEPKEESAAETKLTEEKSAEKPAEAKEAAKPLQAAQTSPKSAAQNTQNAQNVQSTQKEQTSAGTRTAQPRETSSRTAQPQTRAAARTAPSRETSSRIAQSAVSPRTADEKLKEEFLKRLRALSGEYFEYYSVYLLERYSLKSGRRLEGLRISGGKNDGGIDGEIELTDRFGFRETIYIQAKNWDPTKGLAEKWMIGETLVQQFVGAATCRQMRDGKRNCRGIFVTTSTFTKDAKDALEVLGEKFIGYDGNDVFETAKECEFGLIKVNGVWQLDEKLLAGDKAFFNLI